MNKFFLFLVLLEWSFILLDEKSLGLTITHYSLKIENECSMSLLCRGLQRSILFIHPKFIINKAYVQSIWIASPCPEILFCQLFGLAWSKSLLIAFIACCFYCISIRCESDELSNSDCFWLLFFRWYPEFCSHLLNQGISLMDFRTKIPRVHISSTYSPSGLVLDGFKASAVHNT